MKLTISSLKDIGLGNLVKGTQLEVPYLLREKVDLLFEDNDELIAFMKQRYLNDYRLMAKIMTVLNQLVRYYHLPVTLYCLSYRTLVSEEIFYYIFRKHPIDKEI